MSSIASMMTHTGMPPGFFQAGARASHMPAGLERMVADAASEGASIMSLGDARSYSSQLIVEQFTIQITARMQTFTSSDVSASAPVVSAPVVSALDFSAEATAERIFSFSISLFAVYDAQNPEQSTAEALANFEQLVRDAIDEGFGEARSMLEDLGRLDEQIAEFIDRTYAILDRLLDEFFGNAAEGEAGELQPAGAPSDSYWAAIEVEYQYLSYESLSISQSDGSFSAEYARLQFESLSISMSYGEIASESNLQYLA